MLWEYAIAFMRGEAEICPNSLTSIKIRYIHRFKPMKLPNGDRAELGDKLERYCLNYEHQKGKHKALLFEKRLGITIANKEILEQALKEAAIEGEAELFKIDQYGTH
jgi:hypothetical protein